jgi:hypothetical protein
MVLDMVSGTNPLVISDIEYVKDPEVNEIK